MTARPPDFEPLSGTDPVPADTDEIDALGQRYTDTAAEIEAQARNLRRLAASTTGGWTGKAGQAFQSRAADLATRISRAQERYAVAGQALSNCAQPMYDAQQQAYAAVWQAKDAQQQLAANIPGPPPVPGGPPGTAEETATATRRRLAYDDATTALASARRRFDSAVQDYQRAAAKAAAAINAEISTDPLKDSWWDRNFGWISNAFKVVAIVVTVLAIVALVLICPLTAGVIAGILGMTSVTALETAATAIGLLALGGTVAQSIFDGISMATDKESWTSFAIDLASLAAFGLGEGAGTIIKGLVKGAEEVGEGVAAGRAGRAFMSARGLPGILYSLGSRSRTVATILGRLGQGDKLQGAIKAATDARGAVAKAVKDAEPGNLVVLWSMNSDIGKDMAKLSELDEKVPGVLRIIVPKVAATGLTAIEGGVQWATFAGGNAYNVYQWTSGDDPQAGVDQTVTQFRQVLSRVS
jgi:WXG100 family type VII secretion target